jgi:hypothetical protein
MGPQIPVSIGFDRFKALSPCGIFSEALLGPSELNPQMSAMGRMRTLACSEDGRAGSGFSTNSARQKYSSHVFLAFR